MQAPDLPENEVTRVATLRSLNILDTSAEERFDRLTRLAKRLFGVPIALVSLVDANRQWFKSCVGLDAVETPRDISFCGHAILGNGVFVIPDALADPRFSDNPLVTGAPNVRFYAGCPLQVSNGSKIGTLCLIDVEPREFDSESTALLQDLARMVEQEIEAVQLATMDELTSLSNRRGFEVLAQYALAASQRLKHPVSLLFFDLNGFKKINDSLGHAEGDRALVSFANVLQSVFRSSDIIGRMGGDEFSVLLANSSAAVTTIALARLQAALDVRNIADQRGYDIRYSVGCIEFDPGRHQDIQQLLADADAAMYAHKKHAGSR